MDDWSRKSGWSWLASRFSLLMCLEITVSRRRFHMGCEIKAVS